MRKKIKITTEAERYMGWDWAAFLHIERNTRTLFKITSNTYLSLGIAKMSKSLEISLIVFSFRLSWGLPVLFND